MKNRLKQIFIIVLYFAVLGTAIYLRWSASQIEDNEGTIWLYDLIVGTIVASGTLLFKSIRDWLQSSSESIFANRSPKLRMLVYGLGRSGKSTIIDGFLKVEGQIGKIRKKSTLEFNVQEAEIVLSPNNKRYTVAIADYKGQKPSDMVSNAPESFFGGKGKRQVNVVLFVVDLFPELRDDNGELLEDSVILKQYKSNAKQRISKQIEENKTYINKFSIEPVFNVAYSAEKLMAVRLLINKADLLAEIIERGYVGSDVKLYQYALECYDDTIEVIKKACADLSISNFSVQVISAGRGLLYDKDSKPVNLRSVFGELLAAYTNHKE